MKRAFHLVAEINRRDIPHRKGWKPSEFTRASVGHLDDEVAELSEALSELYAEQDIGGGSEPGEKLDAAREELADVVACALQIAYRLGVDEAALEAEIERKLRLRFIGAAAIKLPTPTFLAVWDNIGDRGGHETRIEEHRTLADAAKAPFIPSVCHDAKVYLAEVVEMHEDEVTWRKARDRLTK